MISPLDELTLKLKLLNKKQLIKLFAKVGYK